jgi:hypothetical protein
MTIVYNVNTWDNYQSERSEQTTHRRDERHGWQSAERPTNTQKDDKIPVTTRDMQVKPQSDWRKKWKSDGTKDQGATQAHDTRVASEGWLPVQHNGGQFGNA